MSPTELSMALQTWILEHQLTLYLRVLAIDPWANVEVALGTINVEEIKIEAIWAYLDLPADGMKEVETLAHGRIVAYYRDYSTKCKTYKTMGG